MVLFNCGAGAEVVDLQWEQAASRCFSYREDPIDDRENLKSVSAKLAEARTQKDIACEQAEKLLSARKTDTNRLITIVGAIKPDTIFFEKDQVDREVKKSGEQVIGIGRSLLLITPRLGHQNSKILGDASTILGQAQLDLAGWSQQWNFLNQAGPQNPAAQLKAVLDQDNLLPFLSERGRLFLTTLPGYLFGTAPAPKSSLEAFGRSIDVMADAIRQTKEFYTSGLKFQARTELSSLIAPEINKLQAELFYATFGNRLREATSSAIVASSRGACLVAQGTLQEGLDWVSAVAEHTPLRFEPYVSTLVTEDLARIKAISSELSRCDFKQANAVLVKNIVGDLAALKRCEGAAPQQTEVWADLVKDIIVSLAMSYSEPENQQRELGIQWVKIRQLIRSCKAEDLR